MTLRVAELESVFTGDVAPFEKAAVKVETRRKDLTKKPTEVKVTADTKAATAGMDRVEAEGKRLSAAQIVAHVDANIAAATKKADKIRADLAVLEATETTPEVDADIAKARKALGSVEASIKSLQGTRAKLEVLADTAKAEAALDDVADKATDAGKKAGEDAGSNLAGGIVAAIATIPVAGAVVGIGAAIGKALMDGLQVEVRSDLVTAQTGLDPVTVAKVARVAGEAYADNFGESIAGNMQTARAALQSGLLDPAATARDSQQVIESLDGVATILGEDIPRVSRSAAQLLRTGLAKDAAAAFDIIVKGQQAGLNVSEDWLDTLDEYSTQFRKLGLEGPATMGLLSQAVKAGARDTDIAADALKEFSIRAVDGSDLTKASFEGIGLSARTMSDQIAAGGPAAADALDQTLDRLRAVEDPALRAQIAVGLFGTQAEDLGDALYAMDLTTAIDQLGTVAGVAQTAVDAMGDNAAGSIATAERNIEVAADGIKGALATAFNPEIESFAEFVSENREAIMTFLLELANGGFDAGRAFVEFTATGTEAIGDFIAGPMASLVDGVGGLLDGLERIPGVDLDGAAGSMHDLAESMRGADDVAADMAETIRTNLITNGIDPAQAKLNEVAIPMIAQAAVHDASMRLAQSIDGIGYAADGSKVAVQLLDGAFDTTTETGRLLDEQVRAAAEGLADEALKAREAGETQDELNARYEEGRVALVNQLEQMGLTAEEAEALAGKYGAIPGSVETVINVNTTAAERRLAAFKALLAMPDVIINADMRTQGGYYANRANGGWGGPGAPVTAAANGLLRKRPMIAKGGANILWAEAETGWEAYISGKPSELAANRRIATEAAARLGMTVIDPDTTRHAAGAMVATTAGPPTLPSTMSLDRASVDAVAAAIIAGARDISSSMLAGAQASRTSAVRQGVRR